MIGRDHNIPTFVILALRAEPLTTIHGALHLYRILTGSMGEYLLREPFSRRSLKARLREIDKHCIGIEKQLGGWQAGWPDPLPAWIRQVANDR